MHDSQFCKPSLAHSRGDGFDGGEEVVEEEGETASSTLSLPLLVQDKPCERHGVHIHIFHGPMGTTLHCGHSEFLEVKNKLAKKRLKYLQEKIAKSSSKNAGAKG